jgi:predicted nucleotidyltransferase
MDKSKKPDKIEEITLPVDKLKEYNVGVIYHFGSTVSGYEFKFSDVDLGIVFTEIKILKNSLDIYTKLYILFANSIKLPYELDIVLLQQTSYSFQYQVISEGKVIYEVSPAFRMDYEENVINRYLDFKYVDKIYSKVIRETFK